MIKPKYIYILIISILGIFVFPKNIYAATTVTSLTPGPVSVGRYQKYEATFDISRKFSAFPDFAYPDKYAQAKDAMLPYYYYDPADNPSTYPNRTSPYGIDGITINAIITAPSGKQITQPAFYFQNYTRTGSVNSITLAPTSTYNWKIRFAPEELGAYHYYVTIQDKDGTTRYPTTGTLTFTSESSASKGFIRTSNIDSRYLAFSDSSSFIPISSGGQWGDVGRSYYYENMFSTWKQNGINFTRIWDQNDGFNLTTEGHYDKYSYPDDYNPIDNFAKTGDPKYNPDNLAKGTQINQRSSYDKDKIFESAEQNNVFIQLCSHSDPYWIWDASDINESWNHSVRNSADTEHVNYWKRNYRYRIARWGYSTSLLGWELINENGHIVPNTDGWNFFQAITQYESNTDPYRHIRTDSQNSQAYSPAFWSQLFDLVNYHWYLDGHIPTLDNDETATVTRFAWCLTDVTRGTSSPYCQGLGLGDGTTWASGTKAKPIIWGEIGIAFSGYCSNSENAVVCGEYGARFYHNIVFAGLFSPMGSVPVDWWPYYEDATSTQAKLTARKAASNYFSGIDYAGSQFTFLTTSTDAPPGYTGETFTTNNVKARVLGMRRADKKAAYVWVQNRDYTWKNANSMPGAISPTVTVSNLFNEAYKIEIWNTHTVTNQIISTQNMTASGGSLSIVLPSFVNDVAIKIESTTSIATKTGDANGDGKVDGIDYVIWLNHYGQNVGGVSVGDFNNDSKVDGVDYVLWLNNYGK